VSEYRVYGLDVRSHIVRTAYFQAATDEEAIDWARAWMPTTNREIWQGRRKVLLIKAQDKGPPKSNPGGGPAANGDATSSRP
jgi:hypothetical protein